MLYNFQLNLITFENHREILNNIQYCSYILQYAVIYVSSQWNTDPHYISDFNLTSVVTPNTLLYTVLPKICLRHNIDTYSTGFTAAEGW
jgi:hypothetical protein